MKLTAPLSRDGIRIAGGILASGALSFLYARGGPAWLLGFVALAPWLRTLDHSTSITGALLKGWAMAVAFTAAAFAWFGVAIGSYTQLGTLPGVIIVLLAAPLLQPQFLTFALVRHITGRGHGALFTALAGSAAWVVTEWLAPKFLGDTLGYGLYPSRLLRQAADFAGTAGLTVMLLLANEAVCAAWARRSKGARAVLRPLVLAALVPLALAGYGLYALNMASTAAVSAGAKPLRLGMVQSNIVDYERLRREKGAEAVIREVLDTHFAMSYDAVERQHADAMLWSETVYPTTFGHPKNEAGAELDREIKEIINAARVPFVFGTFDVDSRGEYNAAAFVAPEKGLLGFYRKTRLFPFTEYLPSWLDGPAVRSVLPWAGAWQPGNGARVFPLYLKDGREIPVLPLICLDDVDTNLAIDGARLGGQAILTLSNDSWFTAHSQGADMHQTAAAFRSIETRLPQFRVTTNGYSAVIDSTGTVIAGTKMGERTLVVGDLPVGGTRPQTLMLAWGDWLGRAAAGFLVLLGVFAVLSRALPAADEQAAQAKADAAALPSRVVVIPPAARWIAAALRLFSRGSLLWIACAFLLGSSAWPPNTLAQIRLFTAMFIAPEVVAWLVLRAFTARATLEQGVLVLCRGTQRLELRLSELAHVSTWAWPLPGRGITLTMASGERHALLHHDPAALTRVLAAAGSPAAPIADASSIAGRYDHARRAIQRRWLDHWVAKFVLLPLMLAMPAFRMHQVIIYGDTFGEYHAFGLKAYLLGFALWWAAWTIGTVVSAAAIRAVIELSSLASLLAYPAAATDARRWLERLGLIVLFAGLPAWLLMRAVGF